MPDKQLEMFSCGFSPRAKDLQDHLRVLYTPGREFRAEFVFWNAVEALSSPDDNFGRQIVHVGRQILGAEVADRIVDRRFYRRI